MDRLPELMGCPFGDNGDPVLFLTCRTVAGAGRLVSASAPASGQTDGETQKRDGEHSEPHGHDSLRGNAIDWRGKMTRVSILTSARGRSKRGAIRVLSSMVDPL